jgi:uncharacterized damage-inducible protein DinB
MQISDIQILLAYDRWANARLLRAAAELSADRYAAELGGSFGSVRATLGHIVAVEWLYLRRWLGESPPSLPGWAAEADPAALRKKLDEAETGQKVFLASLGPADLERPIRYTNIAGKKLEYPLGDLLVHLVNHSTHHRGQAAALIRQAGAVPPATDYLVFKTERIQ